MSIVPKKTIPSLLEKIVPVIKRRVHAYHELFSLPLTGELWEETLHRSFKEIGQNTSWKPDRSHAIGEDMRLDGIDASRISCKSGQFINDRSLKKRCVKFNGSRSTGHETLEEKVAHFSASHDDYYFLLAKEKPTKEKPFNKKYKLLVFESEICKVNKLEWKLNGSEKQWNGTGTFKALISKSMSEQLWTTLPLDLIRYSFDIDVS